ncbi:hypothetical protein, partial [uncultured Desulfovibrio sp.]|uniref:hypothetical protein n=1 Tax=uncultured Desulfovibrio sp. TaxID=167968 RepID=UPI0026381FB6
GERALEFHSAEEFDAGASGGGGRARRGRGGRDGRGRCRVEHTGPRAQSEQKRKQAEKRRCRPAPMSNAPAKPRHALERHGL